MGGSGPDSCLDSPRPIYVRSRTPFKVSTTPRFQPDGSNVLRRERPHLALRRRDYTSNPARAVLYDVNIHSGGSGCTGGTSGTTAAPGRGSTRLEEHAQWRNRELPHRGGWFGTIGWGRATLPISSSSRRSTRRDIDLLDLICPINSSSYRAVKVPLAAFELGVLRSNFGAMSLWPTLRASVGSLLATAGG